MPDALRLLADREAIAELVRTYARAVDQRDFATIRDCFAPDFRASAWGPGNMDRDETMAYIEGVAIFRSTMHMMGNQLIHVDGDTATAVTRALLTHRIDSTPDRHEHSPRYLERLARRDGRWVIVERGGAEVLDGPGVRHVTSPDPAVRWLLDRAAVGDVLARDGFHDPARFLGSLVVELDGDRARAWSVAMPVADEVPAEVTMTPTLDVLERDGDGWRLVGRTEGAAPPVVPAAPSSDEPAVRALLDRASARDVVVAAGWRDGLSLTNNHRVTIDGAAAEVETYAYRPPAWGEAPERWVDRLVRSPSGWELVEHRVEDNRMPDDRVR